MKLKQILEIMNRLLTYFLIAGLLIVGCYVGYTALNGGVEPVKEYKFITRSGADSTQVKEYLQSKPVEPIKKPVDFIELILAIIPLTIAVGGWGFTKFKREVYGKFETINDLLLAVTDQRNRESIDARLVKIEQDAAGFVDDDKIKALIEGIGSRTRLFVRDVMAMDFNADCYDKAIMKMNARVQDSKNQIKDLGFSNYFEGRINEIRGVVLKQLKTDLTRLMNDNIHNSKYERFGEIICMFQQHYLKEVVKLHHEYKPEQ